MKQLLKTHPFASMGFVLAACVTLFFLVRIVVSGLYWADPAHHNLTAKPWMTVGYIAKSWKLDAAEIDQLAGLPSPKGHGPWTLQQVATERGVPVAEIIAVVNASVARLEAEKQARKAADPSATPDPSNPPDPSTPPGGNDADKAATP